MQFYLVHDFASMWTELIVVSAIDWLSRQQRGNDEAENHGNTLYVIGLSTCVTEKDLEDHFSREGKVGLLE